MHIALFSRCSTADQVTTLTKIVTRWPDLAVSVALSGPMADTLADSDAVDVLAKSRVEWVRSGRTAPSLGHVPDKFIRTALAAEDDVLTDMGLAGSTLYFEGPPSSRLPRVARDADMTSLLTPTPAPRSGVLVHLDMVIPCFGVAAGHDPVEDDDGLAVWNTPIDGLEATVDSVMRMTRCDLTTPSEFLLYHIVGEPFETSDLESEPDPLLARKLVRLSTRLPARPSTEVTNHLLDAASVEALDVNAGPTRHRGAHESLISARAKIDDSRRRNDDWAKVSRLDWDADGSEEVQVELATTSFVLDPHQGGQVLVLDDKASGDATGWIQHEPLGVIARTVTADGDEGHVGLAVSGIEERRAGVSVGLETADRDILVAVTIGDRALDVEYAFTEVDAARFGPELPLAIGRVEMRVDGGDWTDVNETMAVTGHRFRLRGETRQVLISSLLPSDLFIRPAGDSGVVVWPNWLVSGTAAYSVRIDLNP